MRWMFLLAVGLAACTEGTDPDGNSDRIPAPLDDPFPYDSKCDGYEGTPIAGAMGGL